MDKAYSPAARPLNVTVKEPDPSAVCVKRPSRKVSPKLKGMLPLKGFFQSASSATVLVVVWPSAATGHSAVLHAKETLPGMLPKAAEALS